MMGVDDIAISFAISYLAGSIPAIKELLIKDQIEDRLEACYQKALKQWSANNLIRASQSGRMYNHLPCLIQYIQNEHQEIPNDIKDLIIYWVNELKNDSSCSNFIIEHKMHFMHQQNDKRFHELKECFSSQFELLNHQIKDSKGEIIQLLETLQTQILDQQTKNIKDQLPFISNILNNNVEPLLHKLNVKTALAIINTIESSLPEIICQNKDIADEIKALKQLCLNLIENKHKFRIEHIDVVQVRQSLPDSVTLENLNKWLNILYSVKVNLGDSIPIIREYALKIPEYTFAYEIAHQFFKLLEKTEIPNAFSVFRAFYFYWSFIVKNKREHLQDFQCLDKSSFGEDKDFLRLIEVSMLFMDAKADDAFYLIASSRDSFNAFSLQLIALMSMHTQNIDHITWGLKTAIQKQIIIGEYLSELFAFAINKNTALKLLPILSDLYFENDTDKIILTELCKYNLGRAFDICDIKDKISDISDTMLAYSAFLIAQHGDVSLAFEILNPKIKAGEMDIKQSKFLEILSLSKEYRPHLYKLLKDNRKQGIDSYDNLLIQEFYLAEEIADSKNALEVISILYERNSEDENVFTNYIKQLAKSCPDKLDALQTKVANFQYENCNNIKSIYISYAENQYIVFATEFLVNQQYKISDDDLKHFFYTQSISGFIHPIINKEYEYAEEGLSILYCLNGENKTIILKSTTPLGKEFLKKKKGDIINFKGDQYSIEGIFSKYFKASADYMTDLRNTGGNEYMHLFKFDKNDPLGCLDAAIAEFNPERKNHKIQEDEYIRQYENNEIGLIQFIGDASPVGSYYKHLFTSFKTYIEPCNILNPGEGILNSSGIRFILDLPACIMLFEFSLKYDCVYKTQFTISTYLYELIKKSKKYILYDLKYDMLEGVTSGYLKRLDSDPRMDCEKRLQCLIEWIEINCEIEVMTEALAISMEKGSLRGDLLANTVSCLMNPQNCLVSDDRIYSNFFKYQAKIITTEAILYLTEDRLLARQYSFFMLNCNFQGVHVDSELIAAEYAKLERGIENLFQHIIDNGKKNPAQIYYAINAGINAAIEASDIDFFRISFTKLFSVSIKHLDERIFTLKDQEYILACLSQPFPIFLLIKECFQQAVKSRIDYGA